MISNFSDIFRQNMLSRVNEGVGDYIAKSAMEYADTVNPSSPNRKFFNRNNILDLIRRKKYDRATKLIKANRITPFSLFDGVGVFGNTYDRIPFVAAALAVALEKSKNTESMCDRMSRVMADVFVPCGINSSNMFDAKYTSPNGCDDVLSFILTHDGQINPKKYDDDRDLDVLLLINWILSNGYTLSNSGGLLKYVMENDMISSLKKLVECNVYSLNADDIARFSLSPVSNIGRYISFSAPHPFRFHSPEMEYDDKGKFSGGSMYSPLKSIGYDISKPDKEFKVHISIPFMLKDFIEGSVSKYSENGESFTNIGELNLGDGSEFCDAVNMLKFLSSEYNKYIHSNEMRKMSEDDRTKYMVEMVKSVNSNIARMQSGMNSVLSSIGFPKVILVMNEPLEHDDGKILYKTSPFMKEIWNTVKLCR